MADEIPPVPNTLIGTDYTWNAFLNALRENAVGGGTGNVTITGFLLYSTRGYVQFTWKDPSTGATCNFLVQWGTTGAYSATGTYGSFYVPFPTICVWAGGGSFKQTPVMTGDIRVYNWNTTGLYVWHTEGVYRNVYWIAIGY